MKTTVFIVFLSGIALFSCTKQNEETAVGGIIELPLEFVEGFGPFASSYGTLHSDYAEDDSTGGAMWARTNLPVRGVPKNWRWVKKSMAHINYHQFVFQNFKAGNIHQDEFESLQKSWEWTPNENELSATPIQCFVYVIWGADGSGRAAMMIDKNNNLDFSDETSFYPEAGALDSTLRTYEQKHIVNYETYKGGRAVGRQIPMVIKRLASQPMNRRYIYSFPRYAETKLKANGKTYEIAVNNGFSGDTYGEPELFIIDRETKQEFRFGQGVGKDELLTIGSLFGKATYRNKGVNTYRDVLQLVSVNANEDEYSLQISHRIKPFKAKEFRTGVPITSLDYQGKYLFIDFWGTWCKPCVAEIPELQRIYEGVDKKRVEFVSIAGGQSPELLTKFLKKRPLAWPQIISDDENKLVETYHISSYPTNVLVGPDGRVVARNLHGEALEKKLAEVTGK